MKNKQEKIWECKIGEIDSDKLPPESDSPMREAIRKAYRELTGSDPQFLFSGWGGELTAGERGCVERRVETRGNPNDSD